MKRIALNIDMVPSTGAGNSYDGSVISDDVDETDAKLTSDSILPTNRAQSNASVYFFQA